MFLLYFRKNIMEETVKEFFDQQLKKFSLPTEMLSLTEKFLNHRFIYFLT